MTLTDPIAEMLTIIRNGLASSKKEVKVSFSKLKMDILEILKKEGFVEDYKKEEEDKKSFILIILKYSKKTPKISSIKRLSKPGRRVYIDKINIPTVKGGRGRVIISTSQGVLSDKDAKKKGVGGEALLEVW